METIEAAFPPPSASEDAPPATPGRGPAAASDAEPDDRAEATGLLAEVALHRATRTPLTLGVFGPAGSGKSRFLRQVAATAAQLSASAVAGGPFLPNVVVASVEAAGGRDPSSALAAGVLDALGRDHAGFAEDALGTAGDARETARRAADRLTVLRRGLDDEQRALDALAARRARVAEAVLFDGAGPRLDGFAHANRGRIEARLRAFGLSVADPVRTFKALVREVGEAAGALSRPGLAFRSLWAFKGQGALFASALLLLALGWGAEAAAARPEEVADWLAGAGDRFTAVTDGARAHLDLLGPIGSIALALGVLAALADAVRAARFLGPVLRGVTMFQGDVAAHRRALDGLLADQTRRVDGLAAEAEAASRGLEAAERRADGRRGTGLSEHAAALAGELFGAAQAPGAAAEAVFAALSAGMAGGRLGAPGRVVVALDGLERLPDAELAAQLDALHRLVARPGFVSLVALERDAAMAALGALDPALAAARLDRAVGLSYDLGAAPLDASALAARLIAPGAGERAAARPLDASRSALDRPFEPFEVALLQRLAAGTPRGVRRFVDSYRVARADPRLGRPRPGTLGALALALALDGTAAGSELSALDGPQADPHSELGRALDVARAAVGGISRQELQDGLAVARRYGRRG